MQKTKKQQKKMKKLELQWDTLIKKHEHQACKTQKIN